MSEAAVHVTTFNQWKSVLDVWFSQGHQWAAGEKTYQKSYFKNDKTRYLGITEDGDIVRYVNVIPSIFIEYSEFMEQQKEGKEMETYYVTKEQLDLIYRAKDFLFPLTAITDPEKLQKEFDKTSFANQKAILRYLGGDETIEFKVKEPLLRLWRIDEEEDTVYMTFVHGTPDWTATPGLAFTAPLDEIKKWITPAWSIERAD